MTLSIPAIALTATIIAGSTLNTETQFQSNRLTNHYMEADRILRDNVYKYPNTEIYGAHDYGIFKRLPELRENTKVFIDGEAFEVARTMTISQYDTWILRRKGVFLMTCANENRDRFIVILKPL